MDNIYERDVNAYWSLLRHLRDGVKIRLITLLSESLSEHLFHREEKKERDLTQSFISKYAEAWEGDESAEDIIAAINWNKSSKDPASFD